ncbi:30S ribosomal protein S17 [Candidatus Dojkabacteria bacterium]|nr:30S ribosomal protein S17 [Candidatus Dojkabacteria bacterium]
MAETKKRKTITGIISKLSGKDTAKVRVESKYPHARFEKIVKHHTSYVVHVSDKFSVKVGDIVKFSECKPVSKLKKWEVVGVIKSI